MSFFDDASLAFLPSGGAGKDTKAYSIKPTDGSGDFTFSRGSNLAATRVGPTGLIEKGRENLLTYSNDFSNADWTKSSTSVTSGQSGYDGSSDAWLLERTGASAYLQQTNTDSGVLCYSVYLKKGTYNWAYVRVQDSAGYRGVYFDLENATTGLVDSGIIDYNIEAIGTNGWYRCSIVLNSTLVRAFVYPSASNNGVFLAGTGDIYIQDAQLEIGLAASEVITSGATTGKAGLLEDEPRFDYSGGATCPSLLLEPSRTQLVEQSEYFGGWILSRTSAFGSGSIINDTTSPEGFVNAAYIQQASGQVTAGGVFNAYSYTSGTTYTLSLFAKKKEGRYLRLGFSIGTGNASVFCNFDLQGGISGSPDTGITPKIEDYGNGWYRCSITKNSEVTGTKNTFLYQSNSLNSSSATPLEGIYIYGAQLEEGSYATSYIPNHSGGSVTRGKDSNVASGLSSVIGQTEGTIFIELDIENLAGLYRRIIGVSDGTIDNSIQLTLSQNGTLEAYISQGGTYSFTYYGPTLSTGVQKLAITYKTNEAKIYNNGTLLTTNTSVVVPACSNLYLGKIPTASVSGIIGNKIKQSLLFDTAISEADAITLTTL